MKDVVVLIKDLDPAKFEEAPRRYEFKKDFEICGIQMNDDLKSAYAYCDKKD
jgi:hypothetical protein